jgi:LAO/AO transport system kinase
VKDVGTYLAGELVERLLAGDRVALARVLSLIERRPLDAGALDALLARYTGRAGVIGVTGAPGAGKSTVIGSILKSVVERGERAAVLALDPLSPLTRGAVLGDRLRMDRAADSDRIFVRSMSAEPGAGGLALAAPFAIRALDAGGWPWVIVETVGVGQGEFDIVEAATTMVLVLTPAAGDEVQAAKAGVMEMADVFVVNKADLPGSQMVRRDTERAVRGRASDAWCPPVVMTVASEGTGVDELWASIMAHQEHLAKTGELERRRLRLTALTLRSMLQAKFRKLVTSMIAADDFTAVLKQLQTGEQSFKVLSDELLSELLRQP